MSRTRCIAVVHIYCATCGYPASARDLKAAHEALSAHVAYTQCPTGRQQLERVALVRCAGRLLESGGARG